MLRLRKLKSEIRKDDVVKQNNASLKAGELELINAYTRRQLGENEIYVFSVVLCDNEIDRDHERFSETSLESLAKLFTGVTGVMDHDPKSKNQTARIFFAETETVSGKLTSDGRPYVRLMARAYMPRTEKNADFIMQLESGIKKEVSVGCAVKRRICSVCGNDIGCCGHIKGKSYGSTLCYAALEEPTDAYEWSFVAVPAQKAAGVIKSYKKGELKMDVEKRLFSGEAQSFTADEMNVLAERFRRLHEKAADGETYRRRLEADIAKTAAIALPELKRDTLDFITGKMSAVQLEELCGALSKKAAAAVPLRPQLAGAGRNEKNHIKNNDYKNI